MEKWKLYALISMLFAGVTSVIAKFGMEKLSSDVALAVRTCVVFGLVILNAFAFRNVLTEIKQTSTGSILLLAASGITTSLSWIFYYRAIKEGQVSFIASIDKASILVTILLSFALLKEPLSAKVLIGAGFILLGLLILIWK